MQTHSKPISCLIEGRRLVTFVVDPAYFKGINKGVARYEGWSNSATWCFFLYFTQEEALISKMRELLRKIGPFERRSRVVRAARLLNYYQLHPLEQSRIQVDDWCSGRINVTEFVREFMEQYSGS